MKSTKIVASIIMAIFFAMPATLVSSHEGQDHHADKGPHGGEIVMTGNYHYEMIVKPGGIDLYVLDANLKALPVKGIEGNLQIQSANNVSKNVTLVPIGDYFKAAIDLGTEKSFIANAILKIDGKENVGRFRHASKEQVEEDQNNQKYTCPMHPGVVQDKLGKCPKCGMDLVPMKSDSKKDSMENMKMDHMNMKH